MNFSGQPLGALLLGLSTASADVMLCALGGGKMFRCSGTQAAVAAQFGMLELKNPNGSGKTLFGFGGDESGGAGRGLNVVYDGTTLTPAGVPTPMLPGGAASVATFGVGSQAAPTGTPFMQVAVGLAAVDYVFPIDFWFAVPPNHLLQVQGGVVNLSITINLGWIELAA